MPTSRPSPVAFFEEKVLPAAFDALDRLFPEYGFVRRGRGWVATNRDTTKAAHDARPDRVVCNVPGGLMVHGVGPVSWLALRNGGTHPRGGEYVEAVKALAREVGIDPAPLDAGWTEEDREAFVRRHRRGDLLEDFLAMAHRCLVNGPEAARRYAEDRVGGDLAETGLGLYPSPDEVRAALHARGFEDQEVEDSGLVADARWTGRLLIPWRDPRGRVATIAARCLDGAEPKYLYLRGGTKPPALGLDVAAQASRDAREGLVLVEGLLDVVNLHARGMANVAATGGTFALLTPERWETIAGLGVERVVLASDADEAGRDGLAAALRNARKARNVSEVYVVDPEAYGGAKDPDELVRERGLDAFREVLVHRRPAAAHEAAVLLAGVSPESPDADRRAAVEAVLDLDANLRGPRAALDREDLIRQAAEATGYSVEALLDVAEDHAARRRRREAEETVAAVVRDLASASDPFEAVRNARERLARLTVTAEEAPPPFSADRLEAETRGLTAGIPTGWRVVDALDVRFHPGELAIVAARTGHGKTTAAVNLLARWLVNEAVDGEVVFYSCEEPEVRVYHRLLAWLTAEADLDDAWTANEVRDFLRAGFDSRGGGHRWPPVEALDRARETIRRWEGRLRIVYRPSWTIDAIAGHAHEVAATAGVGAVVLDYLQRIRPGGDLRVDRRDQEVSAIGRAAKALAVDLSAPVVAAAQVNRAAIPEGYAKRLADAANKGTEAEVLRTARPDLHHLREGGSEQEADLVLGLMNHAADLRTEAGESVVDAAATFEVGVLKSRYGRVGVWAGLELVGRYGYLRDPRP